VCKLSVEIFTLSNLALHFSRQHHSAWSLSVWSLFGISFIHPQMYCGSLCICYTLITAQGKARSPVLKVFKGVEGRAKGQRNKVAPNTVRIVLRWYGAQEASGTRAPAERDLPTDACTGPGARVVTVLCGIW
jgi:hypothetical protein